MPFARSLLCGFLLLFSFAGAKAQNGVSDKEIVIGQFAAMSGPAASSWRVTTTSGVMAQAPIE